MALKITHKYFTVILSLSLALLTALSPFAIDTYLSAMPDMASFFGVGINMIEITLTIYFLGFALGNFIGGPLSDSFGRKKIALTGIVLYCLAAFAIPFSHEIYMVWLLRLLQAFGGGFASVTAMVFVKDLFKGKQVAKLATLIGMIMMLAPLFAPVIGGTLLLLGSWKLIFFF
jgi:DHA1 family bicyclomycin/chloramphenicol resistance-like MFS transporter